MPRRPQKSTQPIGGGPFHLAKDRVQPGNARQERIHRPHREHLVSAGVFTPANRWRQSHGSPSNILERPLALAKLLPFLPKYNFARS